MNGFEEKFSTLADILLTNLVEDSQNLIKDLGCEIENVEKSLQNLIEASQVKLNSILEIQ
jgi:hypothetical protein